MMVSPSSHCRIPVQPVLLSTRSPALLKRVAQAMAPETVSIWVGSARLS